MTPSSPSLCGYDPPGLSTGHPAAQRGTCAGRTRAASYRLDETLERPATSWPSAATRHPQGLSSWHLRPGHWQGTHSAGLVVRPVISVGHTLLGHRVAAVGREPGQPRAHARPRPPEGRPCAPSAARPASDTCSAVRGEGASPRPATPRWPEAKSVCRLLSSF